MLSLKIKYNTLYSYIASKYSLFENSLLNSRASNYHYKTEASLVCLCICVGVKSWLKITLA